MTTKQNKVCIECKKDLGRYWGKNFCKSCLGELLNEKMWEEDKRHANMHQES